MNRASSITAGIGYATIFGFSFLVTKGALDVLNPMELIFIRFLVAALVMSALAAAGIIKINFKGKKIGVLFLTCLFQPVLYFIFETYGVMESATSTAGIILGALPATVALLGVIILKEKTTTLQSTGLALSIMGVAIVVLGGGAGATAGETSILGALLLIGSMLSAAFFNVLSRKASFSFTDFERTFAMMWSGAIVFGSIVAIQSIVSPDSAVSNLASRAISAWFAVLYLGVLSSVVAFFLINYTLTRLKASQSAVFTNLVTVITVLAGVVIRKENFDFPQALGAIVIILGVWIANRNSAAPKIRA